VTWLPLIALALAGAPDPLRAGDWPTATPAEAGFAPDLAARLDSALAEEASAGIHAVVLIRDGKLVYERYLAGDDEMHGVRKQGVVFTPDHLHDVRSISKSVTNLLYGIALADGSVTPPDAPLLAAFPEHADLADDPERAAITVRHMLSMTMGTEWNEDLPYSDPANSEIAMNRAPDSLRYALDRPMVAAPGTGWTYNGGATEIAAELIMRGTGQDLRAFAEERLFGPLGITRYRWMSNYYDRPIAASGLRLRPRDTARIGQLVLNDGAWEGRQIVPAEWIATSTSVQTEAGYGCSYGYFWWLCPLQSGFRMVEGVGWGGQELFILPELDLVLVVNAGLYGDPDAWKPAMRLLEEVVIPAVRPH
jgi:CubicO group peptidase (beta-lactamase class C family)